MLDPVIHPVNRLRICAVLRSVHALSDGGRFPNGGEMRFSALRDAVGLSDSALSKQLSVLEEAGYVARHSDYGSMRGKHVVWVSLTPAGLAAFEGHVDSLRVIAEQ